MLCLFFNSTATTEIYTLSLHDALPICPNTHIHFDTFTIRNLELSLTCTVVNDGTLNVRSGPSKTFSQIAVISNGDTVEALGKSPDGLWIKINMEGSEVPGWVGVTEGFLSCTPSIDLFPIVNP